MTKPDFLYNQGMKVVIYSRMEAAQHNLGWHREGTDIAYYKNQIQRKGIAYYTLTFTMESKFTGDEIFIAADQPYTYTDLLKRIKKWCGNSNIWKARSTILCKTLAGNDFPMITITNFNVSEEIIAARPVIIFTARVHPGYMLFDDCREVNGSYTMDGVIQYLVSEATGANKLRNCYMFKIVPMLNPDGVIIGNYRCSLAARDLNRQWLDPKKTLHPEIYATKYVNTKCTIDDKENSRNKKSYNVL